MSIVHGKLYTMGDFLKSKDQGDEFVLCYDADTGKELWRTKVGPVFRNGNGQAHAARRPSTATSSTSCRRTACLSA